MKRTKKLIVIILAILLCLPMAYPKVSMAAEQYYLPITVNKYLNSYDAIDRVNSVGKSYVGTYNIYKKYNGMLNISKSAGPGAWINPAEVTQTSQPAPTYPSLYRVNVTAVNLRTPISDGLKLVTSASKGRALEVYGIDGNYLIVNYMGRRLYAWANFFYKVNSPVTKYTIGTVNVRKEDENGNLIVIGSVTKNTEFMGSHMGNGWFRTTYKNQIVYIYDKLISSAKTVTPVANSGSTTFATSKKLAYPEVSQDTRYYCGPANVQAAIRYLYNIWESQDTIASRMGTRSSGTSLGGMLNYINSKGNANYIQELVGTYQNLKTKLMTNIDKKNKPIIALIANYDENLLGYFTYGHYLTIYGYSNNGETVNIMDPNSKLVDRPTTYTLPTSILYKLIKQNSFTKFAY